MHNSRMFIVCAGLLGLALLMPRPTAAAWPTNGAPLCTAVFQQGYPAIVSDGAGGSIVAWHDFRDIYPGTDHDIYAQKISATGTVQWPANGVALCTATGSQAIPAIVSDGAGGAIVAWQDERSGYSDIYAQRISDGGTVRWTANGVALCSTPSWSHLAGATSDGAGGAIVAWYEGIPTRLDIYVQRVSADGSVQWDSDGVALCTATGDQVSHGIVSDGAGGAIVAWEDFRNGSEFDHAVYAQRVSADGTAQWAADGVALCSADVTRWPPAITSDGAGGAIVTWDDLRKGGPPYDADIYAQRISAGGAVQWPADGMAVCSDASFQLRPTIHSDGAGGAFVAWLDGRLGGIYAQRLSAAGTVQWTADGVALSTAATEEVLSPTIATDGAGGAIVAWGDSRSGLQLDQAVYAQRVSADGTAQWAADGVALCAPTAETHYGAIVSVSDGTGGSFVAWGDLRDGFGNRHIYAQLVDRDGFIGIREDPRITSIGDVPNDQGGHVHVTWKASSLDCDSLWGISNYRVYQDGAAIATVPAETAASYSLVVDTSSDSMPGQALPWTVLRIEAVATDETVHSSAPESTYSVDDLSPPAPSPFTGEYLGGTTTLHWGVNEATDFATFRLYRGGGAGFVPGPSNLVVAKPDTGYVDVAGSLYFYKLCAVDVHENVSGYTPLKPSDSTTVDVPGGASLTLALESVRPNPSRGERLSVTFSLPRAARATLEVVDVSGRRVVEREVGSLGAGSHTVDLGQGQHLAPGLYLVRLTQGTNTRTTRAAVLR